MFRSFGEICEKIDALLEEKQTVLVAIDGCCGAGKTTLAALLAEKYQCSVFHMDEFFLRPEQRTPERLAQPGGNVDYERFREEVLTPLTEGREVMYRPYDCRRQALKEAVVVPAGRLAVIEGTYSLHPYFEEPYDLQIFLSVSPELQRQRILMRPKEKHRRFFEEWIPMEQRYFAAFGIGEKSDITVT